MKKFLILFGTLLFLSTNVSNAASPIKNYYAYTLVGTKVDTLIGRINQAIQNERDIKKLPDITNAYYAVYNDEHYYIRLYPAHNDTNVYIVADTDYDKNSNSLTEFFRNDNMKYTELNDKAALSEYKFDFIDYARKGYLEGLFIMPDYIKPLKTGMGKLNDKMSKNSKKTSAIPYSEDKDPIDLTCVNTEHYSDANAGVDILVKEYRLKNKENKYVHAYEYLVKNNQNSTLHVNKVTSERLAGLKDITTQTFVDLDRLDLMDTVATFPPVLIATAGTSALLSVPNWVRLAKVTKESTRFAHMLPENYDVKGNDTMRILVLKFKDNPKPLNFFTTRNGVNYNFSF